MKTTKQEMTLIDEVKALNELEFSAFFQEIAQHICNNKWEHIIHQEFDNYEDAFEEMQDEMKDWKRRAEKAEETIQDIKDLL